MGRPRGKAGLPMTFKPNSKVTHGSNSAYNYGCRCDPCRDAHSNQLAHGGGKYEDLRQEVQFLKAAIERMRIDNRRLRLLVGER